MSHRGLALIVGLSLVFAAFVAHAQQPTKVYRIGYLGPGGRSVLPSALDAFRQELRRLGYVEGQNLTIEYRWAGGRDDRLPALAAELVRLKVDVIVVEGHTPAKALGLGLQSLEVRTPADFARVFDTAAKDRADALIVFSDGLTNAHLRQILEFAATTRLPAMYPFREYGDAGGLLSYAPSFTDLFRRAAVYVDKILKGAKPADLPVESATTFELAVNMKTAKALGLTIPPSLLLRADQVIE